MRPTLFIVTIALFTALFAIVVAALWHHKRAGTGDIRLIGAIAQVNGSLEPEGTVILGGELWRARSKNGDVISTRTRVRVVGFQNLLALVEVYDYPADSV